ncbi:MAG TPA: CheR family methyltransferase [Dissulfurispiraceae bacterium]|nr:CheR family methyltransferase [Dissulfurispiraceae bacterium]
MEPESAKENSPAGDFPIVGVGASAGGLNAFECFLAVMPREFGFSIVFVQHLSPKHSSLLPDILRSSRPDIEVIELSDGLGIAPGKLYVCPPAMEVGIEKGIFRVKEHSHEHVHLAVDEFLTSLATEKADNAIAVILSGAGTDGVRGVQAVRSAGGAIFVQDPESAEFPGMPLAVIGTGHVDGVLAPADIAKEILKFHDSDVKVSPEVLAASASLEPFYGLIRDKKGYSFHHYKKSVVARRIRRRMYLQGIHSINDYLDMISGDDAEAAALANDLLIGVTSFFRDRVAWKALYLEVTRKIAAQEDDAPVRIWTPACATGEESYSVAMQLQYELDIIGRSREIQVFATDLNEAALEKARRGRYPASISADVPPEYMKKFFTPSADGLSVRINKDVRQRVVFAKQDLLTDPPFSRLDLIICRNLLIYLEPDAQEKCISIFHYALREGGYLFLGNAESPGRKGNLFKSVSHKKCRIYRKAERYSSERLPLVVPYSSERAGRQTANRAAAADTTLTDNQYAQELLLEEFAPAAVAIDHNYQIVYHNGPTNRYLRQPRGVPTRDLLELLPENLKTRIRGALYKAGQDQKPVAVRAAMTGDDRKKKQVSIRISKVREHLFLVIFREKNCVVDESAPLSLEADAVEETAIRQLECELSTTREELQGRIEQLRGLNEELQSSNEELQAANEELETSREELQSLNEELITVNTQFQAKIEEQESTNNDLNNFLASSNIPTVFLDLQLRVKRFTPAMTRLIKLIPADIGRPILDISIDHLGLDLITDAEAVRDSLVPTRQEIRINQSWYVRTTLPYRTADSRIEGVIITFADISEMKQAEESTRHLASFPRLNPNPVLELDLTGSVVFMNPASQRILQGLGEDMTAAAFAPPDLDAIVRAWDKKAEASVHREVNIKDRTFGETIHLSPEFNFVRIYAYEITERKKMENALINAKKAWELTFDTVPDMIAILDCNHTVIRVNKAMADRLGQPPEKCVGMKCHDAVHGMTEPPPFCPHLQTCIDSREHIAEVHESRLGGDFLVSTTPMFDEAGRLTGAVHVARDITERKRIEAEKESAVEFLQLVNESKSTADLIHAATEFFQRKSGCEAVGIRLRQEYDYPYYETRGFSKEFVMLENRLCARDENGRPILDGAGNPALDCMCGNVICGRFDPVKPFFTKRGSFWANNTTRLLATTTEKDRQARTRNRCNGEGYESVALIGLTLGDERLGLLQLNDRRPDRFTAESIALWERLADYLAVALAKFRTDEALRVSEKRLAVFIEHAPAALAMFDRDMRYVSASRRWMGDFNMMDRDITGLSHYEVFPDMPERWKEIHKRCLAGEVLKCDEDRFDRADGSVQWLSWEVRPWYDDAGGVGGIVIFSEDITKRKEAEDSISSAMEELKFKNDELERFNKAAVGRELRMVELKRELNELCSRTGELPRYKVEFDETPNDD